MSKKERWQQIIDAGLFEHYRRSPPSLRSNRAEGRHRLEWEELMLDLVKKLAVRNSELELAEYSRLMFKPSSLQGK